MQLKRRKRILLWEIKNAWIEARESSSLDYPYPMAIWRNDSDESFCMMKLSHLVEYLCLLEDGEL
ncbi:MAG: hypothetical protein KAS32_14815 [Candidatus Peribacteraceae bacterium]|nr:hypothetical protein [Candidatus Peribacteraceae bacterium]